MRTTHRGQFIAWSNKDEMLTNIEILGDLVIYLGKDHVRISKDDWNKIKPRLMRTMNEEKHGNAENRIEEEPEAKHVGLSANSIY